MANQNRIQNPNGRFVDDDGNVYIPESQANRNGRAHQQDSDELCPNCFKFIQALRLVLDATVAE